MARDRDYWRRGRPGTRAALRCLAAASRRPGPSAKARRFRKWVALTLRQPYQCMVPAHGSSFETPTRHHTRRRGRPFPRRLLLGWSERVRIRQRLRARICAGSGRTPGATPKKQRRHHARTRRGFFKTRVFFVRLRLPRRRSPAGARRPSCSPATRPGLAVNIVKLPEPPAPPIKARPTFGVRPQSTVRDQAVG